MNPPADDRSSDSRSVANESRPRPSAREIRATVLFVDLVGFTALSEAVGAERAYGMTTGCLQLLDGIARRYGGSIDKYQGDALMAVFGHPLPHVAPARDAVRAAVEMRRAANEYVRELPVDPPLTVRIGVNSGNVVAGDVRGPVVREFHVLGDAVNVAARLKARAPSDAIYVGSATHAEAEDEFEWEAIEPLALKGKSAKVPAFQVLGPRASAEVRDQDDEDASAPAFVGRDTEMAALAGALRALRAGKSAVVTLVGPAGAGKSRLAREFRRAAQADGFLTTAVAPRSGGGFATNELGTAIARALEPGTVAPTRTGAPRMLVLDDLDSAGPEPEIRALLAAAASEPLLVLACGEPGAVMEAFARASEKTAGVAYHELALSPLDPAAAEALLEALTAKAPLGAEDRALVLERAAGNPQRLMLAVHLAPALASERARAEKQAERSTETERRRATILFADITGFTAMTEKLGASAAYPLVADCLGLLDEITRKHGGTVEKYLGDCVMSLFGVPQALEDAPRAAVNAAIEMRRRMREYNEAHDLPLKLDVHSGIYTGRAIAGDVSGPLLSEFAVMGEPVVRASALTDLSLAGEIHVGHETWRATRDRFEYADGGSLAIPGLSGTIPSYELTTDAEQRYRRRVGDSSDLFSELVGRDRELSLLRERLAALERGVGGFVELVAEAGLGKSRLVAELESEAGDRVTWLEGRSISTGSSMGFHPFADLLRSWAGIDDQDDLPAMRAKLRAEAARLLPDDDEIVPFLAAVMALPLEEDQQGRLAELSGEHLERAIRARVTRVLDELAARRPLVLVFDDLHWADLSSIELAMAIAPLATTRPVLFMHVFRPHFAATSERVLELLRSRHADLLHVIDLRPLEPDAVRQLTNNLFRGAAIPQRVRARITERAVGNPFYLEEVVRSLVEQGALVREGAEFRATELIHETEIPGSVEELVRSRVDRLPLRQRELVQIAAVIGRSFVVDILRRIFAESATLEEDLTTLETGGFFIPWDQLQKEELAFKHPLLQEVAYDGQLADQRKARHATVAAAIEAEIEASTPGYHAMLAFHFIRGGDLTRAEEELARAGAEAALSAASNEALSFFREASRLYLEIHGGGGNAEHRADLERNLGLALFNRGQLIEAEEHFNAALRLLGERVPESQIAMMLRFARNLPTELARLWIPRRRRPAATDRDREVIALMYRRAQAQTTVSPTRFLFDTIDLLHRLGGLDPETVPNAGGHYASCVGIFSYGGLSFGISERFLARAAPLVKREDLGERLTVGMMNHLHHFLAGDFGDEHCLPDEMIDQGLRDLLLWPVANYLGLETEKRIRQGRWDDARALMARTSEVWDTYGYDLAKTNHYAQPVFLALEQRRLPEACNSADAYHDENPEDLLHVLAFSMRGEAELLQGDLDAGERTIARGEEIVRRTKFPPPFHASSHRSAQLCASVLRLEAATEGPARREAIRQGARAARAALRVAGTVVYRQPQILRLAGRLALASGKESRAVALWQRGLATARAMRMAPEEARLAHEIGVGLAHSSRTLGDLDAAAWRDHASARYQALGLDWDAERLARGVAP